ncbi:GTPase [Streptomyces sp. KR80]|uniref:GTPase n=1 Tax=Streptomyces sp. KR80 TaxID=3457426 RepID=UPI003FD13524
MDARWETGRADVSEAAPLEYGAAGPIAGQQPGHSGGPPPVPPLVSPGATDGFESADGAHAVEGRPGEAYGDIGAPAGEPLSEEDPVWDDGLIARRARDSADTAFYRAALRPDGTGPGAGAALWDGDRSPAPAAPETITGTRAYARSTRTGLSRSLGERLTAMRELVGLSRTRLDTDTLAEATRVLEEATARHRLSLDHTVVAIAGASGSGKSTLFNALAGGPLSEAGVRRPTTSAPLACTWSEGADGLLDRLGIPPRLRRRPQRSYDIALDGLVLIDLPDHDSAVTGRREQVDRLLGLVDAVVWVVDPEKYADAVLHERYLRPLAGYSEVTFVVLNQIDRLPGDATDQVLDHLRRLLDEDGIALGEHGEPGATVLPVSALTGTGVTELRTELGRFISEGRAAERRLVADVDGAAEGLRPVCLAEGRTGLSEQARADFEDRLADAVGAVAAGEAAEREWLRYAERACGAPWAQLRRWREARRAPEPVPETPGPGPDGPLGGIAAGDAPSTARAMVEQAVRTLGDEASAGLPDAWAQAVREAAVRGAERLPGVLDEAAAIQAAGTARPARPGWWSVASAVQGLLFVLQVFGAIWLVGTVLSGPDNDWLPAALVMAVGVVGGPVLAWFCQSAARGPARRYGQEAESRLRGAAASCGRARVLEPVAAELLRYREVRDQYVIAAGGPAHATLL